MTRREMAILKRKREALRSKLVEALCRTYPRQPHHVMAEKTGATVHIISSLFSPAHNGVSLDEMERIRDTLPMDVRQLVGVL